MKRGKNNFKLSNRTLYSLITLGILAIFAVGVYSYGTASPSTFGHSAGELNLNGVSKVITAEAVDGSAAQSIYDIGANNIAAATSIYSYGKICVGNSKGDCSGNGGTVITSSDISVGGNSIVSTGLYGYCKQSFSAYYSTSYCAQANWGREPAYCNNPGKGGNCRCRAGYGLVVTGSAVLNLPGQTPAGRDYEFYFSCKKCADGASSCYFA